MNIRRYEPGIWESVAAGALSGLFASLVMNQFQAAVKAVSQSFKQAHEPGEQSDQSQESGGDATVKTAKYISRNVFHHELTQDEKQWAGPAVHYTLGASLGALYGALALNTPVEAGAGTAYGSAVWLGADEIAVPLCGLSGPPTETPVSGHLSALASHLVFGLTTHLTRKLILS